MRSSVRSCHLGSLLWPARMDAHTRAEHEGLPGAGEVSVALHGDWEQLLILKDICLPCHFKTSILRKLIRRWQDAPFLLQLDALEVTACPPGGLGMEAS